MVDNTERPEQNMQGAETGSDAPVGEPDLQQAYEEEKAKAERYLANWQRAQADFVNLRRRSEQERLETSKYAGSMVMLQILPVVDDLERALGTVSASLAGYAWVDGIRLIYRKLQAVLDAQGLEEIPATGERFDPSIHEAVHYAPGDEGRVIGVLQKGYRLHDRVIRPALVVVGNGGASTDAQASGTEDSATRASEEK